MTGIDAIEEVASMLASISGQRVDLKTRRIPLWIKAAVQQVAQMAGSTACQGTAEFQLEPGKFRYEIVDLLKVEQPDDFTGSHTMQILPSATTELPLVPFVDLEGGITSSGTSGYITQKSADIVVKSLFNFSTAGVPIIFGRWGKEFLFFPRPQALYHVFNLFWKEIKVPLVEEIPLPESLHMCVVYYASHIGHFALKDYDGAKAALSMLETALKTQVTRPFQAMEGSKSTMKFSLRPNA